MLNRIIRGKTVEHAAGFCRAGLMITVAVFFLITAGLSLAADIRVVPSATKVSPGESFYVDIVADNIPSEGLGAVQFRLNVEAAGSTIVSVPEITQGKPADVSVASPLTIGQSTASRSGLGDFFWNGRGPNGVLVMDNETLVNGSGMYTFGHTNGSVPPSGVGSVARFVFTVGKDVSAEKIVISLSDVMLLDSGTAYPLASNTGATIDLRCTTKVPGILGMSLPDAQAALQGAGLLTGNVYELDNRNGAYILNQVLSQSVAAGSAVLCETAVDFAINIPPAEVSNVAVSAKVGDESGTVVLSWIPSASTDAAGYRVYMLSGGQTLLRDLSGSVATGTEISGLSYGRASQLKITAYDGSGNESPGVTVSATPVDTVPPSGSISINNGAAYTKNTVVTLGLSASDRGSGLARMCISNTTSCASWEGYAATRPWTLTSGDELKTVYVWYEDSSGNATTPYSASITLDTTQPVLNISTLSNASWTNNEVLNVAGKATDDSGIQGLTINGDTVANNPDGSFSHAVVLTDGPNTVVVTATDLAGNEATDTRTINLDRTAPVIDISSPADNIKTRQNVIDVVGVVDEQSTVTVSLNEADPVAAQMDGTNFNLAIVPVYGINTIEVTATDRAGNTSTLKRTVTFDDRSPSLAITEPRQDVKTNNATIILRGEVADLTAIAVTVTIDQNTYTPAIINGAFELPITFTEQKTYQIYARAVDEAGNETLVQRNVVYDVMAPAVTIDPVTSPTNKTSQVLTGTMEAGAAVSVASVTAIVGTIVYPTATTWTAELTGMQEGDNTMTVIAADEAGNISPVIGAYVQVDLTPPVLSVYSPVAGAYLGTEVEIAAIASDSISGVSSVEYRIDSGVWTPLPLTDVSLNKYSTVWLSALAEEGSHTVSFRATDKAGNEGPSQSLAISIDRTPPFSSILVGVPQYESAGKTYLAPNTEISLSSLDAGSGVKRTEYAIDGGAYVAYGSPITLSSYQEGAHVMRYRSADNAGNAEFPKEFAFLLDKTPPETTLSASDPLAANRVNIISPKTRLTLKTEDNLSGVKEIRYRIDGGTWQTYSVAFSLSGLTAGEHTISYKSTDNVSNEEPEKSITVDLVLLEISKQFSVSPVVLAAAWWGDGNGSGENDTEESEKLINGLSSMLRSSGLAYHIASSEEDFRRSLRSGKYNTYLLVNFGGQDLEEEVREAVHFGDGLVFIKTQPDAENELDLFGVKFKGTTRGRGATVYLEQSPISDAGTLSIGALGYYVRAAITSQTAKSFGYIRVGRMRHAAIVSNDYGRGKVILFNFNLFSCTDEAKATALMTNAINYAAPAEHYITALDSVPLVISVSTSPEPSEIKVVENIPSETYGDDAFPKADVNVNTLTWRKSLEQGAKASFGYRLNLPDAAGDYRTNTEVSYDNHGAYRFYGNYELIVNVPYDSRGLLRSIISDLMALSPVDHEDEEHIDEATEHLREINATHSSSWMNDKNIEIITKTIDEIRKLSFDATAVRLKLDELLKIFEKKWYLNENNFTNEK